MIFERFDVVVVPFPFVDAAGTFCDRHDRLIDASDHPTVEGNALLAEVIAGLIE